MQGNAQKICWFCRRFSSSLKVSSFRLAKRQAPQSIFAARLGQARADRFCVSRNGVLRARTPDSPRAMAYKSLGLRSAGRIQFESLGAVFIGAKAHKRTMPSNARKRDRQDTIRRDSSKNIKSTQASLPGQESSAIHGGESGCVQSRQAAFLGASNEDRRRAPWQKKAAGHDATIG